MLIREYGPEIRGADQVKEMLTTVRDALRWLRSETLARMNAGMVIEDVVNDIEYPEEWANSKWMPQSYGCADYVIREGVGASRRAGGIATSRRCTPHRRGTAARRSSTTRSPTRRQVLDAARAHVAAGELQLALHVVDLLAMGQDDSPEVLEAQALKAEIAAGLARAQPPPTCRRTTNHAPSPPVTRPRWPVDTDD